MDQDIYGVEVDFNAKKCVRLAGAVGRSEGEFFDNLTPWGGRKRVILSDDGYELGSYGDPQYTETGKLVQAVNVEITPEKPGSPSSTPAVLKNFPIGTPVQVMVKQPKFWVKVVPLSMSKAAHGRGYQFDKARYYVSPTAKPGFMVIDTFKAANGQEQDYIYLSAFEGSLYDTSENAYIKVRRLMCELVLQGKGSTEVANILNNMGYRNTVGKLWKAQSIPQMVYDEKNIGVMIINRERRDFSTKKVTFNPPEEWIRVENAFPPIITPEEWSELCKIRESRVNYYGCKKRGKKVSGYSFSGKIICGECGSTYWRKQKSKNCSQEYWTCSRKIQNGGKIRKKTTANGNAGEVNLNGCDNETISYSDLMKMMQIIAEQLSANTEQIKEDMLQWLYSLRESIMKKSSVYSQVDLNRELSRKDRLLDSYLDGVISKEDYQRKNDELENKISVIEEDLKRCEEKTEDIKDIDRIIDNIDEEISQYITEEKNLKIDFVLKYLESVVMFPDRVIVNIPVIGSEVIVEKVQFVNRKKRLGKDNGHQLPFVTSEI